MVSAVAVVAAACDESTGLPAPTLENVVDTVSLFALDGTPVSAPSGYNIQFRTVVRTDQDTRFDFAFNITSAGQAVLLPTGALGLGLGSGIQVQGVPFDSVKTAPNGAFADTLPVAVDSGTVAVVHSRASQCVATGANVFYYGKVQVLAIDTVVRRIDLRVLVDQNCGYRDLEPGLPRR
ncbi:MAG: hypothetical protein ACRDH5_17240 [bacterium]